ncbi:MAG: cell division transport system permease protein [Candidatus Aldehydirespiratoraceae bacterium]|jgi:cell division transport system permease protein
MAISPVYALRETGQNLARNLMLSFATVITIGMSLWFFGGFFLFNYAVDNATARWEGGIEFVIWMDPDASPEQDAAIETSLDQPAVSSYIYIDQAATYEEFKEVFSDTPEMLEVVSAEALPPSYRVVPTDPDADVVQEMVKQFEGRPGVRDVVSADKTIRQIQQTADDVSRVFLIGSVLLLVASTLLILTNVVMAIRSRGAEIEIMKVVGATNWFIRIPFILEGLVQAMIGALLAWGGLYFLNTQIIEDLGDGDALELMRGFRVTDSEYLSTSLLVLAIAVVSSGVGSMVAVTRYLDA